MKNVNVTAASFVVGKNADLTVRVAEMVEAGVLTDKAFEMAELVKAGMSVGITVRNPHNKKEHIAEVNELVGILNRMVAEDLEVVVEEAPKQTTKKEVVEMKTAPMTKEDIKARIIHLEGEIVLAEKLFTDGKLKFDKKTERINAADREIDILRRKLAELSAPTETMSGHTRTARELWADRHVDISAGSATAAQNDHSKGARNAAFREISDRIEYAKNDYMASLKSNDVVVYDIVYKQGDYDRIGNIVFRVPAGMMEISKWTGEKYEWVSMDDHDYDGTLPTRRRLMAGSGFIRLAIKMDANKMPYISWPKSKGKNEGQYYEVFKTADARFDFLTSDNNLNLKAALETFLLTFWGKLMTANVRNRSAFNASCNNCRFKTDLPIYDGVDEEYEHKANAIDTSELGQYGSRMPQLICTVHSQLMDRDLIEEVNESEAVQGKQYFDEEGNVRFAGPNHVVVGGKPVALYNLRSQATVDTCAGCPFYSKNERKPDKRYDKEVEEAVFEYTKAGGKIVRKEEDGRLDLKAMGIYVSKYWTDRANANAQPVFTKTIEHGNTKWTLGFPGEFENPQDFMVMGIGGIRIYGSPDVLRVAKWDFVPQVEAFRAEEASVLKLVDIIHQTANQITRIDQATLDNVIKMIQTTPKPVKEPLVTRYNRAIKRLADTIRENQ
jgi:hypothetical protein